MTEAFGVEELLERLKQPPAEPAFVANGSSLHAVADAVPQSAAEPANSHPVAATEPSDIDSPAPQPSPRPSGFQRAVGALRIAVPFMQRLLPLLDGSVAETAPTVLPPYSPSTSERAPAEVTPFEGSVAELKTQHRQLRDQITEQNTSLKRVEDQLDLVRQATDRNTLEQQELFEDLKGFGRKAMVFAIFVSVLLGASVVLNVIFLLHFQRVIP
ncbi:MAG TPA: hypothetical protein VMA34_14405 [Terracidiphilus sp.]|nr:hypothetical protein [Terracidiphilus sp.]